MSRCVGRAVFRVISFSYFVCGARDVCGVACGALIGRVVWHAVLWLWLWLWLLVLSSCASCGVSQFLLIHLFFGTDVMRVVGRKGQDSRPLISIPSMDKSGPPLPSLSDVHSHWPSQMRSACYMYVCLYVGMYVCIYVYMYIYIYICIISIQLY